ncbi:hypothetical protein Fmac_014503 [Flemingia macrophylla]|uniref:Phytocyanin domain-containing protein n=1 Tax=Flemingia macrophylla TaxID=520843 RepID=A0ABD1MDX0_9FABA
MALSPFVITLVVIATIFLPSIAMAKEIVVGGDHGWTIGFDYAAWAADKTFQVGDTLVFNYDVGKHNVFKVNGTLFLSCTVPPASEALSTGSDRIVLATPGRKWYICGVAGHCSAGQKLVITVQPQTQSPTLPPSPAPALSPFQHRPHFGRWVPKRLFTIFH